MTPQISRRTFVWLNVVGMLVSLGAGAILPVSGCSSSQPPRDTNYGTDVGFGYVPPDAPAGSSADAATTDGARGSDSRTRDARPAPETGSAPAGVQSLDGSSAADVVGFLDSGLVGGMPCSPTCAGVACGGSDGCGGTCSVGCVCVPSCTGILCGGSDGCGGVCTFGCICIPSCGPLDCGTFDGCGGTCSFGCFCTPSCGPFECGTPDGCGGTCNSCSCVPSCGGGECGTPDGCGGTCEDGCFCSPSCGAFDCGASDGCGGICDDGC